MTKTTALAAAAATLLAACATAPAPENADENPFMTESTLPYSMPPFDEIGNDHFLPAFERGMREQLAEVEAIAASGEPPTFENTIVALERSGELLRRVSYTFWNLNSADTNDALQALERELAPRLAAHEDAIYLDGALFARVDALHERRGELGLDPESKRLLERYHTDFVRAGARLSAAEKERLKTMNAELASLDTEFSQNVLAETNASAVVVEDAERLAGLSAEQIASARSAAVDRGLPDGTWLITLQNTTGQPPLASLHDRALREEIFRASVMRGRRGNDHDNREIVRRTVELRAERAALLGYDSHAAFVLEDRTARTTDAVNEMLGRLAPAALANARAEAADLQAIIDAEGGDFELAPWDWAYYAEKLRAERYAFDESALKPYFEFDSVLANGVFHAATALFGITFEERTDLPVYHPDVRVFEVFEADGSELGLLLVDIYARPSKRGGAWMNSYVLQSHLLDQRPVVGIHQNVVKPPPEEPTLLTFDEVETLFHEFGHALHGLFSDVRYPYFAGTQVPRDFVEYPSQLNEMWATWPEVLANYARHYETGQPIPGDLLEKVLAARQFNQGFATSEYLAASLVDQAWHQLGPGETPDDVEAFEVRALAAVGMDFQPVPPRYHSTYFSHVFSSGYSAGYYSYIWSEVLDADTAEWFREQGGLARESGERLREIILSTGGSRDAMTLYRELTGREPTIDPLLERRGLVGTTGAR